MDQSQTIFETTISGVLRIERNTVPDERGFFREWLRVSEIPSEFNIKQANHSRSSKSTLRGIHVAPWNKLIYVPRGKVQEVIVDFRKDSPTYLMHEAFILGDDNRSSIFIPKGCGNSYLVLSEDADYVYLTDEEWAPDKEYGIAWNDPDLAIEWQLEGQPILSKKDQENPLVKDQP